MAKKTAETQLIKILQIKYEKDIGSCRYIYRYGDGKRGECSKHLELYYEYYLTDPSDGHLLQLGSKHINDELRHITGLRYLDVRPEFRKQQKLPLELLCSVYPCEQVMNRISKKAGQCSKVDYVEYIKVLDLSIEHARQEEMKKIAQMQNRSSKNKAMQLRKKREKQTIAYLNAISYINKNDTATIIVAPDCFHSSSFTVEIHGGIFSIENLVSEGINKKRVVSGSRLKMKRLGEIVRFFAMFERTYRMEFYHFLDMDVDAKKYFTDPRNSPASIEKAVEGLTKNP